MSQCIINVSAGAWYPRGQDRLSASLDKVGYKGARLFWRDALPPNSPTHKKIPYAFKPYAFMEAKRQGYKQIMWFDSAVWASKSVEPLFNEIKNNGYLLFLNGWTAGTWCSDAALTTLKISREDALKHPQILACVMGLDLDNPKANQFLDEWFALANDGITFPGAWTNKNKEVSQDPRVLGHRHDQVAASIIAQRLGMSNWLHSGPDKHICYIAKHETNTTATLLSQGM